MKRSLMQLSWFLAFISFCFWFGNIELTRSNRELCVQSILVITPFTLHTKDLDNMGETYIALLRYKYQKIEEELGIGLKKYFKKIINLEKSSSVKGLKNYYHYIFFPKFPKWNKFCGNVSQSRLFSEIF